VPEVKQLIRSFRFEEAKQVAKAALQLETAREINSYLREQTRRVLPDFEDLSIPALERQPTKSNR
jgi:hypothetical protein